MSTLWDSFGVHARATDGFGSKHKLCKRADMEEIIHEMGKGVHCFIKGVQISIKDPATRSLLGGILAKTLAILLISYTGAQVFFVPAYLVLGLGSIFSSKNLSRAKKLHDFAVSSSYQLSKLVPMLLIMTARYLMPAPLEKVGFSTLKKIDSDLEQELSRRQMRSFGMDMIYRPVISCLFLVFFYPAVTLLSYIPVIGTLVGVVSQIAVLQQWLPWKVTCIAAVLGTIMGGSFDFLTQWFLTNMVVLVELLYPFFGRAGGKVKSSSFFSKSHDQNSTSDADAKQLKSLGRWSGQVRAIRSDWALATGFMIPVSLLMSVPYVGVCFWVLACAAAPALFVESKAAAPLVEHVRRQHRVAPVLGTEGDKKAKGQ